MSATTTAIRTASTQPAGFVLAIAVSAILGVAVGTALDDALGNASTAGAEAAPAAPVSGPGPAGMPQPATRHGHSSQPQVE